MLILLATIYYIIQNKAWSLAPEKTNKAKSSSIAWNNRVVERKWREKEQKKKVNKKNGGNGGPCWKRINIWFKWLEEL